MLFLPNVGPTTLSVAQCPYVPCGNEGIIVVQHRTILQLFNHIATKNVATYRLILQRVIVHGQLHNADKCIAISFREKPNSETLTDSASFSNHKAPCTTSHLRFSLLFDSSQHKSNGQQSRYGQIYVSPNVSVTLQPSVDSSCKVQHCSNDLVSLSTVLCQVPLHHKDRVTMLCTIRQPHWPLCRSPTSVRTTEQTYCSDALPRNWPNCLGSFDFLLFHQSHIQVCDREVIQGRLLLFVAHCV